jgi:hypothetical protein
MGQFFEGRAGLWAAALAAEVVKSSVPGNGRSPTAELVEFTAERREVTSDL